MRARRPERGRPLILFLSIATVILLLCYVAFVASGTPSNGTAGGTLVMPSDGTQASQGLQSSTVAPSCPDARTFHAGNAPSLDFCSPKYHGDVSGPYGSHITLVGENFSSDGLSWYVSTLPGILDENGNIKDTGTLKKYVQSSCQTKSAKDCFSVSPTTTGPLTNQKSQSQASLFYWTWSKDNGFPTTPANYFFLAVTGSGNTLSVISGSVSFTLMTKDAPCITVSYKSDKATTTSSCSQAAPFSLHPGATITITGTNWLLQAPATDNGQSPVITVNVSADCVSCNPNHIDLGSTKPDNQGKFSLQKKMPDSINGAYAVTATARAATVATPDLDVNKSGNTIVDGALTFGNTDAGDATTLILQIGSVPPPVSPTPPTPIPTPTKSTATATPTPCRNACVPANSETLDTISLLMGLPALLSLLLLAVVFVKRRISNARLARIPISSATPDNSGNGRNSRPVPIDNEKSPRW